MGFLARSALDYLTVPEPILKKFLIDPSDAFQRFTPLDTEA
jgi:hypothetical protein